MGNCVRKADDACRDGESLSSSSSSMTYLSFIDDMDDLLEATDDARDVDSARQEAVTQALSHAAEARVLKARDCLLAVTSEARWREDGDDAICRILDDAAFVDRAMADLDAEDGYILSREQPMRVLYKHGRATEHSIKMHCKIKHHPARVVSIPYEWDLIRTWNRFCVDAVKFPTVDPHEALVYGASWMLPPFRDFQALLHTAGFDLSEEHRSVLIAVRNASEGLGGSVSLPKAAKRRRWVEFLDYSYVVLTPVFCHDKGGDDGTVHSAASICVHLDPRIPGVPSAVVNWVLHVFAPYLFQAMERALDNLFHDGSMYRERMDAHTSIYGTIYRAVDTIMRRSADPEAVVQGDGSGDYLDEENEWMNE